MGELVRPPSLNGIVDTKVWLLPWTLDQYLQLPLLLAAWLSISYPKSLSLPSILLPLSSPQSPLLLLTLTACLGSLLHVRYLVHTFPITRLSLPTALSPCLALSYLLSNRLFRAGVALKLHQHVRTSFPVMPLCGLFDVRYHRRQPDSPFEYRIVTSLSVIPPVSVATFRLRIPSSRG